MVCSEALCQSNFLVFSLAIINNASIQNMAVALHYITFDMVGRFVAEHFLPN
jgi:hypothetical protein